MRYLVNGFLLVVPLLAVSVTLAGRLPIDYQPARWDAVPAWVTWPERVLRVPTLMLPLLFPVALDGPVQRAGWVLYLVGATAYLAAWLVQIRTPRAAWSTTTAVFLAPAYTPALWLTGIGLIGYRPVVPHLRYLPWVFLVAAAAFLFFHNLHAILVHRQRAAAPGATGSWR